VQDDDKGITLFMTRAKIGSISASGKHLFYFTGK
jgi:hypothetical protein